MGRQVGPAQASVADVAEEMFREHGWSDEAMPELLELLANDYAEYGGDHESDVFLSVLTAGGLFKANHGIDWCSGERR